MCITYTILQKVKWATQDEETMEEFVEFLTSLVSAQTFYLRACLRMLVKLFLPSKKQNVARFAHTVVLVTKLNGQCWG